MSRRGRRRRPALIGAGLRLVNLGAWPKGPWIDEAYALRAARLLPAGAPLFGTTALTPPGEGFVNAWTPNLTLRAIRALDVAAGGGLASFRALSVVPALLLLVAFLLLAARGVPAAALRARSRRAPRGNVDVASHDGALGLGRRRTSAFAVLATWAFLRALRTDSARSGAPGRRVRGNRSLRIRRGPPLPRGARGRARRRALSSSCREAPRQAAGRRLLRLAALALAAEAAVIAPLAAHYVRNPERLFARERELSLLRHGGADAGLLLAQNVADYAALFFLHGDVNERHGDPARPVVPAAVAGLALFGAAWGALRGGAARALLLPAGLFLAGGLLASEDTGANAYRISPMAPYVLVLAGLGAESSPRRSGRSAAARRAPRSRGILLVAAASDVVGFARWGASPRTWGAFGGPERELADALVAASRTGPPARVVLDARTASRNPYVVEELLAPPGARRGPVVFFADFARERAPLRENVLYADGGALLRRASRGGAERLSPADADPWGRPTFTVYRLSPD